MALTAGTILGQYEIRSTLGAGGMGEVYRAHDSRLDREVAIKVLPESLTSDPDRLRRFEQEARAAAALNHPNILAVYQMATEGNLSYMVTELLDGETLRERLRHGGNPLRKAIDYAVQIAHGLAAAHDKGITHRDLKPENLFVTKDGRVKILDFGLAKLTQPRETSEVEATVGLATEPGVVMGTVGYMSPEQVRGKVIDHRTDIFAFGTVLYEMVTGKQTFRKPTSAETMTAILNDEPPSISQIASTSPPGLQRVVHRCLEKSPEQRFQSASDMAFALEALSDSTITAPSGSQLAALNGGSRRTAVVSAAAVVIVATFVVVAAISVGIYRRVGKANAAYLNIQNMTITRLTDIGKVGVAAISPDGRYVAYSLQEAQNFSLWVRQVSPESTIQVVPPSIQPIRGVSFSPDGAYLYFVRSGDGYVVPTLGGTPKPVIKDTFGGFGVSPDGSRLAFLHGGDVDKAQLLLVNRDGTDEHVLAEHPSSTGISYNSGAAPSWSSDGKFIALTAERHSKGVLIIYPVEGGPPTFIPIRQWPWQALWLPGRSGVLVRSAPAFAAPSQIWLQPFPSGDLQRVTSDLDDYRSLSSTSDGKLLAAVQDQSSISICIGPAAKVEQCNPIRIGRSDGVGLAWLADGTLLIQNRESEFSRLASDGKTRNALFKDSELLPGRFSVCKDGQVVLDTGHILRVDSTGLNTKQLTSGEGESDPDCSPDGSTVAYFSMSKGAKYLTTIPLLGGSSTVLQQVDNTAGSLRYSPSGHEFADIEYRDDKPALVVRDAQTGHVTKSFALPKGLSTPWGSTGILRWTPDGKALTCLLWKGVGSPVNLWRQPLSGGPPRPITDVPGQVVAYDWSPDGKQLALARSAPSRDVVLISNFH